MWAFLPTRVVLGSQTGAQALCVCMSWLHIRAAAKRLAAVEREHISTSARWKKQAPECKCAAASAQSKYELLLEPRQKREARLKPLSAFASPVAAGFRPLASLFLGSLLQHGGRC